MKKLKLDTLQMSPGRIWHLMHRLEMFKENYRINLSNSEWLSDRILNISSGVI